MGNMNKCAYCGKGNPNPNTFIIGAKNKPSEEFTMIYGTGKMACGSCYGKASKEGKDTVSKHIETINKRYGGK